VDRNLAARVASASVTALAGDFERHVSRKVRVLSGSRSGGRWGPPGGYPVLYLGRPRESIVAEAYRALVDGVEGMTGDQVAPRRVLTCRVDVTQVLDLREEPSREAVGLSLGDLFGPPAPCQRVGQAAHQLGLHGLIAPAATEVGETLALFEQHLPEAQLPVLTDEALWVTLPPDPRPAGVGGRASATDLT